jgi:hypothetical protein
MFLLDAEGMTYLIPFNHPTAIAVAALGGHKLDSVSLLDSLVKAGGVCTMVRLLRESNCPVTLFHTAVLIHRLLEPRFGPVEGPGQLPEGPVSERTGRCSELADHLLDSGESGTT